MVRPFGLTLQASSICLPSAVALSFGEFESYLQREKVRK